ncbi:hypothetical protein ACHAXR_008556 [Thalassiosira sp. AJA248-18]
MHYHTAISLLLLQRGVCAFQTSPLPSLQQQHQQHQHHPTTATTSLQTAALDSIPTLESILNDGHGHINSNLAQAIYEWEMDRSNGQTLKKHQFSTRDGLRLVDELAREILSSLSDDDHNADSSRGSSSSSSGSSNDNVVAVAGGSNKSSGISYNDLIQEGMIALLRAMTTYDNYITHTTANTISTFEEYAKHTIQSSLMHFLAHSSRPIRLPLSLQTTLQTANVAAKKLRSASGGKEPSLVQVAKEIQIAPEQLALYRKLHRSMVSRVGTFVSVEDGMEVYDPTLVGVGMGTGLNARRDLDDGVLQESSLSSSSSGGATSTSSSASSPATTNEQDLTQLNSQEDDWTREPPERVVAPLRDVLTDTEEINNPLSYTHHFILNEELNEFLLETLTEEELTVIQLRFGLVDSKYGGRGWSANEIGERMGMDHENVVRVASAALDKLRKAASTNWEEDNDAYVEISL